MAGIGMFTLRFVLFSCPVTSANIVCHRMLRDAEFFKTRIGGLEGAGDAGDYIVNLVKEKSVPKAVVPETVPAAANTNGKTSSGSAPSSKAEEEKVDEKDGAKDESIAPQ